MKEHSENFNKELQNIRKYKTEVTEMKKNTRIELKNTLEINSRLDDTEEWISNLEDRIVKSSRQNSKKKKEFLEMRIVLKTSRTTSNALKFTL